MGRRNRIEESDFKEIALALSLDESDIRRVVYSFFGQIVSDAKRLPFDDETRIFSKEKFGSYAVVRSIPFIGRVGPVYSRYRSWRSNEGAKFNQVPRSAFRKRLKQSDIENTAAAILSGRTPSMPEKKKPSELYKKIWFVDTDGKKLAKQVIPKE